MCNNNKIHIELKISIHCNNISIELLLFKRSIKPLNDEIFDVLLEDELDCALLLIVEAIVCITSRTTPPAIIIPVFCTVGTDDLATPLLTAVARPATVAPNPKLLPILLIY